MMPFTGPDLADRVRGMLLGVAIGDALGNRSESRSPQRRFDEFVYITDYLPNRHARGRRVATSSDDTQLTFWTVEHLLEHGRLEPDALSTVFASRQIYGRGRATGDFVHARQARASWQDAGQASAGNGALMRIARIVLPHLRGDRSSLSRETAIAAAITHNDPLAIASAVAWVALLWRLLDGDVPDSPVAWLDGNINVLRPLDHDQEYVTRMPDGPLGGWRGSASALLDGPVRSALTEGLDVRTACNSWYSGAYLLETVPSVMYILARHGHEPEVAIEKAVNETRDNDTVAADVAVTRRTCRFYVSPAAPLTSRGLLPLTRDRLNACTSRASATRCSRAIVNGVSRRSVPGRTHCIHVIDRACCELPSTAAVTSACRNSGAPGHGVQLRIQPRVGKDRRIAERLKHRAVE